jgi:hypothetical protein
MLKLVCGSYSFPEQEFAHIRVEHPDENSTLMIEISNNPDVHCFRMKRNSFNEFQTYILISEFKLIRLTPNVKVVFRAV